MSLSAAILRRLSALQLPPEAMAEVLSIFAELAEGEEARLQKQRQRKARSRDKSVTVTGQERDEGVTCHGTSPEERKVSPHPSKETQTPNTPSHPSDVRPPKRGSRIPPDWMPSPEDIRFAELNGLAPAEIEREGQRFANYWISAPGQKGVKLDWPATWRNWVLRCVQDRTKPQARAGPFNSAPVVDMQEVLRRIEAKENERKASG